MKVKLKSERHNAFVSPRCQPRESVSIPKAVRAGNNWFVVREAVPTRLRRTEPGTKLLGPGNCSSGLYESEIESCEHQDNSYVHDQPFPKLPLEEEEIDADDDGYHQQDAVFRRKIVRQPDLCFPRVFPSVQVEKGMARQQVIFTATTASGLMPAGTRFYAQRATIWRRIGNGVNSSPASL